MTKSNRSYLCRLLIKLKVGFLGILYCLTLHFHFRPFVLHYYFWQTICFYHHLLFSKTYPACMFITSLFPISLISAFLPNIFEDDIVKFICIILSKELKTIPVVCANCVLFDSRTSKSSMCSWHYQRPP